ncbi:MAG: NADH:flavin oxidoreductase [Saprospiraceae bacterium]
MKNLTDTLTFPCGKTMKNRFALAPMTNCQSHEDGILSEDEYKWLVMRAKGQFGLTMTCASHVQAIGKGFPGQLGIFDDKHIEGQTRLAEGIKAHDSLAVVQLHHAGMRSPKDLIGEAPVCPSDNEKTGARAMTLAEVKQLRDDFIQAAVRSQKCGYDGVQVHGAHGYILTQFLSAEINHRTDEYGGSLENRARLIFEIVDGIREACGTEFLLCVRLSPERFGMQLEEVRTVSQQLIDGGKIDFLDISLWDSFKEPEEEAHKGKTLLAHFEDLDFKNVLFTVAGKILSGKNVTDILDSKVDFVSIGRSAIVHHDFPAQVVQNPNFEPIPNPVSKDHLRQEGLGEKFVTYMCRWKGFVKE